MYFGKNYVLGFDKDLRIHTIQSWLICMDKTVENVKQCPLSRVMAFFIHETVFSKIFFEWSRALRDCEIIEFITIVGDFVANY